MVEVMQAVTLCLGYQSPSGQILVISIDMDLAMAWIGIQTTIVSFKAQPSIAESYLSPWARSACSSCAILVTLATILPFARWIWMEEIYVRWRACVSCTTSTECVSRLVE